MIAILFSILACTDNQRAKVIGGTMEIRVPCDQDVFDVTWKGEDFWYATQPAGQGWNPTTKTFREYSSYGVIEGQVDMVESRCVS